MSEVINNSYTSNDDIPYNEYFKYDCPHCNSQFVFNESEMKFRSYGSSDSDFTTTCPACNKLVIIKSTYSEQYGRFIPVYSDTLRYKDPIHISKNEYIRLTTKKSNEDDNNKSDDNDEINNLKHKIKDLLDDAITKYVGKGKI